MGNNNFKPKEDSYISEDDGSIFQLDCGPPASSSIRSRHGVESDLSITGSTAKETGDSGRETIADTLSRLSRHEEKYLLVREVGRGGMGIIVSTMDTDIRREVAMKLMRKGSKARDENVIRFLEEAQIQGQLEHPSICPVHELGIDKNGQIYFTMKMIKGKSLGDIIRKARKDPLYRQEYLSNTKALNLFQKICEGMAFAHSRGVIHRDLKPDNIMVGDFGEVYIMDWGLAKIIGRDDPRTGSLRVRETADDGEPLKTLDGSVIGTPAYMPPEQARGLVNEMDEQSDIYSLGAVLYELLTLEAPFFGRTPAEIIQYVITTKPYYPSRRDTEHNISPELDVIVMKCLEKEKPKRYRNIAELKEDIDYYLAGKPITTMEYSLWEICRKWVGRNRFLAGASLAFVLLFLVSFIIIANLWLKEQAGRREQVSLRLQEKEARLKAQAAKAEAEKNLVKGWITQVQSWVTQARVYEEKKEFDRAVALYAEVKDKIIESALPNTQPFINLQLWRASLSHYPELKTIESRGRYVEDLALSPDNRLLAAGTRDGLVRIYDTSSGRCLKELAGHEDCVTAVDFSPDGRWLASGSFDASIRLWDVEKGTEIALLSGHEGPVNAVCFSPGGQVLATGGDDSLVIVWDLAARKPAVTFREHSGSVNSVAFNSDGKFMVSGSDDFSARLWDMETRQQLHKLSFTSVSIQSVAFRQTEDNVVLAGYGNGRFIQWYTEVNPGTKIGEYRGHTGTISSVASLPASTVLISGCYDHTIRIWYSGAQYSVLSGHRGPVRSIEISEDGTVLASGSHDGTIKLWKLDIDEKMTYLDGHEANINAVVYSPDGRFLASAGDDSVIKLWDLEKDASPALLEGHEDGVLSLAFGPDSRLLISGGVDRTIILWNVESREKMAVLSGHTNQVDSVAVSPDGLLAASGSLDKTVRIWDISSKKQTGLLEGHGSLVSALAFSPDGTILASGEYGQVIKLWNVPGLNELATFTLRGHRIESLEFSKSGEMLASAGSEGFIKLWDVGKKREIVELAGHTDQVRSISFSSDTRILASGSYDETVRFWNVGTGEEITAYESFDTVTAVDFNHDSTSLAVGIGTELRILQLDDAAKPFHIRPR